MTSSKKPIAVKLGIKSGNRVALLNSPKGYSSILEKLPAEVVLTTRLAGEPFDLVQAFYFDQKTLKKDLPRLKRFILSKGKIWICWKKGNVTDLSRDSIMESGLRVKLDAVATCAINDEWSGVKLMYPKQDR